MLTTVRAQVCVAPTSDMYNEASDGEEEKEDGFFVAKEAVKRSMCHAPYTLTRVEWCKEKDEE